MVSVIVYTHQVSNAKHTNCKPIPRSPAETCKYNRSVRQGAAKLGYGRDMTAI
jgi:hypothetical protein